MQLKILTKVSWLDIDFKEVDLAQSRNCSESIDSACSRERIPKTTIDFLSYRESHWTLVLLIDALSHLPTIVVLFAPSRNCFDFFLRLLPRPPAHSTHSSTMQDQKLLSAILLTAVIFLISTEYTLSCNRSLCASQVSKCLLTQSCKCEMKGSKNCTCCKDCYNCLSWLWEECCSCVGKISFRWKTQLEIPQTFQL